MLTWFRHNAGQTPFGFLCMVGFPFAARERKVLISAMPVRRGCRSLPDGRRKVFGCCCPRHDKTRTLEPAVWRVVGWGSHSAVWRVVGWGRCFAMAGAGRYFNDTESYENNAGMIRRLQVRQAVIRDYDTADLRYLNSATATSLATCQSIATATSVATWHNTATATSVVTCQKTRPQPHP